MAKKKCEECPKVEAWLTSWADMMSLLLVLFIVLFAMANTDLKNFAEVAASLRAAFNNMGINTTASIVGTSGSASSAPSKAAAPLFFDALPPRQRDFVRISTELTVLAQELDVGGEIDVNLTMEGMIISLSDELAFEPGTATLRPEAYPALDKVADFLRNSDVKVRIEGNTDDIPTNSPLYPSNWELSTARAVSIVHYLVEEDGIAPNRLTAAGNAEFNPLVPNDSRVHRRQNRRADIVLIYPGTERKFSLSVPGIELPPVGLPNETPSAPTAEPTPQP